MTVTYYLSGRMRGEAQLNFPLFGRVATQMRKQGLLVVSPHEFGDPSSTRGSLMGADFLAIIGQCDAIACLPGWQQSPGACAEVACAFACEKPVYDVVEQPGGTIVLYESKVMSVTVPREDQYRKGIPLVGLCGFAQSGKDTVAEHLVGNKGWSRVAFADSLKDVLYALNPIVEMDETKINEIGKVDPIYILDWVRVQQLVDRSGWDHAKVTYPEVRALLQRLGTEAGRRVIDDNLWVGLGEQKIEAAGRPVVITDCRFPNEVQMVRRRGGKLIWIHRPGVGAVNNHASEHSVTVDDCDRILVNDREIHQLQASASSLVDDLFGAKV